MRAGEVLREAWAMYNAHRRHFITIAFVTYLLLAGLNLLFLVFFGEFALIVAPLVAFAGVFWLQGALVTAVDDVRDGRADLGIRQTIAAVRPYFNRLSFAAAGLLVLSVIVGFAAFWGFVFFVVPGLVVLVAFLIFLIRWSLVVPVIVLDKRTVFGALDRSQDLVKGNTWRVTQVILATIVIVMAVAILVGILLAVFGLPDWLAGALGTIIIGSLTAPFAAIALTLVYYRLRELKAPAPEPEPAPAA